MDLVKIKILSRLNSSETPEKITPCLLQLSECQCSLPSNPFINPESTIPTSASTITAPLCLTLTLLLSFYKIDYIGLPEYFTLISPPQDINLITSAKYFLLCKLTFSQILGFRMWTYLMGHYSANHNTFFWVPHMLVQQHSKIYQSS